MSYNGARAKNSHTSKTVCGDPQCFFQGESSFVKEEEVLTRFKELTKSMRKEGDCHRSTESRRVFVLHFTGKIEICQDGAFFKGCLPGID